MVLYTPQTISPLGITEYTGAYFTSWSGGKHRKTLKAPKKQSDLSATIKWWTKVKTIIQVHFQPTI